MEKSASQNGPSEGPYERRGGLLDFLSAQARRRPVKEVALASGLDPRTVKNLRAGERGISLERLVEWCARDPQFAAAFAEHIGVLRPGEAEIAGALTMAVNAYVRRQK